MTTHAQKMTTFESAVMPCLSDDPLPIEALASLAQLSRGETRLAIVGLVDRGLAVSLKGGGYALHTSTSKGVRRPGDVFELRFVLLVGDAEERLGVLADKSVDVIIMSSPYYRERDYGTPGQIGWEDTDDEFVARVARVLAECRRVLADHGLIFFNFDDHVSQGEQACIDAKLMTKLGRFGLAKFREIIWYREDRLPNGTDNAPAHAYEKIFVLKKHGEKHYWDAFLARQEAKSGGMKRMDDVWVIPQSNRHHHSNGRHFATFPVELVRRCLEVSTSEFGYCAKCGAPWERVLKRGVSTWKKHGATRARANEAAKKRGKAEYNNVLDADGKSVDMKMADMRHVGWRRTCHHKGATRKAVVADPFLGSGTTGLVALERGYEFFGIDINPSYVADAAVTLRKAAAGESAIASKKTAKKAARSE